MVSFKVVIGTKQGKCLQKEIAEPEANTFLGKKIGDKITGDNIGFSGYEFEITGGSDHAGFPMRKDVQGVGRKKVLEVKGVGVKKKAKGIRQRKTVCGNTVHPNISQINLKIVKEGKEPLPLPKKEDEKKPEAEEKPAEKTK